MWAGEGKGQDDSQISYLAAGKAAKEGKPVFEQKEVGAPTHITHFSPILA